MAPTASCVPHAQPPLASLPVLYNAITVASAAYQAHHTVSDLCSHLLLLGHR